MISPGPAGLGNKPRREIKENTTKPATSFLFHDPNYVLNLNSISKINKLRYVLQDMYFYTLPRWKNV